MPTARKYPGNGAASTITSGITSGSTTIGITDASTWPATGTFSIVIDRTLAGEEKILGSRSGNTFTASTRGADSTTAAAHNAGATVECVPLALDFQDANDHVTASTGVHGLTGAVVGTTDAQTLTNKSGTFDAASTIGGVSGTALAADRTAWTAWTPVFGNVTSGTGNFFYKQIGKTLQIRGEFTGGTATASAAVQVNLPAAQTSAASGTQVVNAALGNTLVTGRVVGSDTNLSLYKDNAGLVYGAGNSLNGLRFQATLEVV